VIGAGRGSTRWFKVTNPDGSTSYATVSGFQVTDQDVPGGVEITHAEYERAMVVQADRDHAARLAGVQQAQQQAQEMAGWRQVAANTLTAAGMSAQAVRSITGTSSNAGGES
jgi:hypothetical protein